MASTSIMIAVVKAVLPTMAITVVCQLYREKVLSATYTVLITRQISVVYDI